MQYKPVTILPMRIVTTIVCTLLLFSCDKKEESKNNGIGIEMLVNSLVQKNIDSVKIAGVAVGVFKGNEPILLKSYGFADLEFDVRLPVNASFEIGSITKQFTGAAMLQLVGEGKISLDDDITKYIKFDTRGKKITVRQLLNHTSGIRGYTEIPEFPDLTIEKHDRDTLLRIIETKDFDFSPGEALIYNNTGFFIAGLIIEKVSGLRYEDYISQNLFAKAGMTDSYYCSESKIVKNRAHGYQPGKEGLIRAAYLDHTWPFAAGSICSTVEDLLRWNQALHHSKILSKEMYDEFILPARLNNGTVTRYAKGITVTESNGRKMLEHGGGIYGFVSENRYFPDDDISIIVLINTAGPVSPDNIAAQITDRLFGKATPHAVAIAGDIGKYTGKYKGRGRGQDVTLIVEKADSILSVSLENEDLKRLYYEGDSLWSAGTVKYKFFGTPDSVKAVGIDMIYGYYVLEKVK